MTQLPIVKQHEPDPEPEQVARVDRLAEELPQQCPELKPPARFAPLVPDRLEEGPTLHLDDLSEIPVIDRSCDHRFLQERARFRARPGDFVASCFNSGEAFRRYSEEHLGLGPVTWLHPDPPADELRVALACREDRRVRRTLVHALRMRQLTYLHPHIGISPVWELAALLRDSSRCPVKVIAPSPGVTRWANDKLRFADTIVQLFGESFVPRTEAASNFATLTRRVHALAVGSRSVAVKLPDSAGGGGTLVIESAQVRSRTLDSTRRALQALLGGLWWRGGELLVGSWETDVLCSPAVQLWIPPPAEGPPIVEGVFIQRLRGPAGVFEGSRPADLPPPLTRELVNRCWLLTRLFQRVGYLGRCSFDTLLIGTGYDRCHLEFVECNGRWGGTSGPLTLMNRLVGDWSERPFVIGECSVAGLGQLSFADVLDGFAHDLFDQRTGQGRLVFYNPGRMQAGDGIDAVAMGETLEEADHLLRDELPRRLADLVATRAE